MNLFKWVAGRQKGTLYKKMLLLQLSFMDIYLLKYEPFTYLAPHRDTIPHKKHWRVNLVLCGNGTFVADQFKSFFFGRLIVFRSDIQAHAVINGNKKRYVLSIGFYQKD